jgi:LmbE family N-acetylglucosaminyl deacetylase
MRWIYLSPHLDDAVLSAGGLIHDQTRSGIQVEIWTLMCGFPPEGELSPFAQKLHTMWKTSSTEETIRIRRAEDVQASGILGAKTHHFDFLDCMYRRGAGGEWLYDNVFVQPHPEDAGLTRQIAQAVSARLQPDDVLVCQRRSASCRPPDRRMAANSWADCRCMMPIFLPAQFSVHLETSRLQSEVHLV